MNSSAKAPAERGTEAAGAARSRQQARTAATRRKLLLAAEQTFARDGYEAARLEDIAARAGYTRGAFYANFESKEGIFFALLEQWVAQRIAEVNELLERHDNPQQRLRALREHCGAASGGSCAVAGAAERVALLRWRYFAAGDEIAGENFADFLCGGGYGFGGVFSRDVAGAPGGCQVAVGLGDTAPFGAVF
jgi:AcrR family transcriptional regulator